MHPDRTPATEIHFECTNIKKFQLSLVSQ